MNKPSRIEEMFHQLNKLASGPITSESVAEIRRALTGSNSLLVSKAAEIIGSRRLHDLIPEMTAAFDRFMVDGPKTDKQCKAKIAIINALNELEFMGDSVFLTGVRHVQMEPSFGNFVDTAVKLRSGCAFGLARINHPDVYYILTELLVDEEYPVRSAAAMALAYLGTQESELMLRLKVLTGDSESEVISECFVGLMTMVPDRSLEFVSRYLRDDDLAIAEYAALAIGGSRISQALDTLRKCWDEDPSPAMRRALLLPIALIRSDEAVDFLAEAICSADVRTASQAVSALSLYADGHSVNKVHDAVKARNNTDISDRFRREFGIRL